MSLILSLETATPVCSVALYDNGVLKELAYTAEPYTASSKLAVMIDEVLNRAKVSPKKLKAIAVSSGPGSYTGLRIGIASAKGLCFALSIPLIAVNSLEAMAKRVVDSVAQDSILCPMLDARRMEVYCLLTDTNQTHIEPTQAKVIDEQSFSTYLEKGRVVFFGNGAMKCRDMIKSRNAVFMPDIDPSAEQIGALALKKYEKSEFEDIFEFEPLYLKDFLIKKPKSIQ